MKKYYFLLLLAAISFPLSTFWQGMEMPASKAIRPMPINDFVLLDNSKSHGQILAHNLWDKQRGQIAEHLSESNSDPNNAEKTDRNWQLKAVKMPSFAIIKTAKGIKHFFPQQTLPSGEVLKEILIDGIVLEKNTKKYNVYLFGKKPKSNH